MPSFVSRNFGLVLQSEADIVEPFEQTMAGEVVDLELCGKRAFILYPALLEIDSDLIIRAIRGALCDFSDFLLAQHYR